jgi:hypothetical protein
VGNRRRGKYKGSWRWIYESILRFDGEGLRGRHSRPKPKPVRNGTNLESVFRTLPNPCAVRPSGIFIKSKMTVNCTSLI